MASLPAITSGVGSASSLLLAVPQVSGLFGNQVGQTIGYQPQGTPTKPADNILGSSSSTLNVLFAPLPALLFNYEGEQTLTFESDITDHFVEDNTTIQDQWALKPGLVTTQGFIGELNDVPANKALQLLQIAANKLTAIGAYAPALSLTALEAYQQAFFLYQTASNGINSAISAYNSISGGATGESVISNGQITVQASSQSKQQVAFQQFQQYQATRTLFTVQTPWVVLQSCAIQSLKAVQDADTQVITGFSVTFKQMRFASSLIRRASTTGQTLGRLSAQSSDQVNNGSSTPATSNTTSTQLFTSLKQ